MPRSLVFLFGDRAIPCALERIDRTKLYGRIEIEARDDAGRPCQLATLASDGRTIVPMGGRGVGFVSADGEWVDRGALVAVAPDGTPVQPVASSFTEPIPLVREATVDEYLAHVIRAVYLLGPEADLGALRDELARPTIYTFPFSFRGGLVADVGFLLLGHDGHPFLAVGQPAAIRWVGLEQAAGFEEDAPASENADDDELDFGLL